MGAAARRTLLDYPWPGNVRQLRNVIDSAVVLAEGDEITVADLGLRDLGERNLATLSLTTWEQKLIRQALHRARGNVASAAKLLGIGRATLYRKLETFGIER
jgi:Nif-specific regulatory protein